jgi:hypothetical protein
VDPAGEPGVLCYRVIEIIQRKMELRLMYKPLRDNDRHEAAKPKVHKAEAVNSTLRHQTQLGIQIYKLDVIHVKPRREKLF